MKKVKTTTTAFLLSAVLAVACLGVWGCEAMSAFSQSGVKVVGISEPFSSQGERVNVGSMSYKVALDDGQQLYRLMPTYDNKQAALSNMRDEASGLIGYLQRHYMIPLPFSDLSWRLYRDANENIRSSLSRPGWQSEYTQQSDDLMAFFDIYENEDDNNQIINTALEEGMEAVELELPYDCVIDRGEDDENEDV